MDSAGGARIILQDQVSGPVRWGSEGKQIACLVNGNETFVSPSGTSHGEPPGVTTAELKRSTPTGWLPNSSGQWEAAIPLIRQSLNWWSRGHHAMHRGEYRSSREALREAVSGFKQIRKKYVGKGLSGESCEAYFEAIRSLKNIQKHVALCFLKGFCVGGLSKHENQNFQHFKWKIIY